MKRYLVQFIEQFVDGQMLLHDIDVDNLTSDLMVKSVHAPSIMRGVEELQSELGIGPTPKGLYAKSAVLDIAEIVTVFNVENESPNKLQDELHRVTAQCQQIETEMNQIQSGQSQQVIHRHVVSNASTVTSKTFYSEGDGHEHHDSDHGVGARSSTENDEDDDEDDDDENVNGNVIEEDEEEMELSPTPPLPEDELDPEWRRYVKLLQKRNDRMQRQCTKKDRELKRLEALEESMGRLQREAKEKEKVIKTLNKRVAKRDEIIKGLKQDVARMALNASQKRLGDMERRLREMQHQSEYVICSVL